MVLGEFTIASLLNFDTVQVVINLLGKRNAGIAVAVSVAALLFAFVLLVVVAHLEPRRRSAAEDDTTDTTTTAVPAPQEARP